MIDVDDIRLRYGQAAGFLDERGRRLFGANEALAHGHGGVSATARATGLARSTIDRGVVQLLSGGNDIGARAGAVAAAGARVRRGSISRLAHWHWRL